MQRYRFRIIAAGILLMAVMPVSAAYASAAPAGEADQETRAHLANLRAIKPGGDKQTLDRYNKQMDRPGRISMRTCSNPCLCCAPNCRRN